MPVLLDKLIWLATLDPDGGSWAVISPEHVPDELTHPAILTRILNGECVKVHEAAKVWYRVQDFDQTLHQLERQEAEANGR